MLLRYKEEVINDNNDNIVYNLGGNDARVICVYEPQSEKLDIQKDRFYDKPAHEWDIKGTRTKKLILGIEDFNGHVRK